MNKSYWNENKKTVNFIGENFVKIVLTSGSVNHAANYLVDFILE